MWRNLSIFTALFLATSATAGTATATWTNPTAYVDGSPLPADQIAGTVVEWGTCAGTDAALMFASTLGVVEAVGAMTRAVINLPPMRYCFRAATRVKTGMQSDWSAVASKTILPPAPKPPVLGGVQ